MTDRPILFSGPMVRAILREIKAPGTGKTMTRRVLRDVPPSPGVDAWLRVSLGKAVKAPKHSAPYFDAYCNARRTDANPRGMSENWCWWTRDDRQCLPTFRVGYATGDRLWVRETWGVNSGPGVWCSKAARPNVALTSGVWSPVVFRATTDEYAWGMYGPPKWRPSIHMPRTSSRLTLTVTGVKVERLQDISEADAKAEGVDRLVMEGDGEAFYLDEIKGTYRCGFAGLWEHINGKREGAGWDANPWVVAVSFSPELRNIDAAPAERERSDNG